MIPVQSELFRFSVSSVVQSPESAYSRHRPARRRLNFATTAGSSDLRRERPLFRSLFRTKPIASILSSDSLLPVFHIPSSELHILGARSGSPAISVSPASPFNEEDEGQASGAGPVASDSGNRLGQWNRKAELAARRAGLRQRELAPDLQREQP